MITLRHTFPAMGTRIQVVIRTRLSRRHAAWAALARVEREVIAREAIFSRFNPNSELSGLNRRAGRWCPVSRALFAALVAACRAYRRSGGLFDPAILAHLERLGYDRDYRTLTPAPHAIIRPAGSNHHALALQAPHRGPAVEQPVPQLPPCPVQLEAVTRSARVTPGRPIDLGGIVKGMTADAALRWLERQGFEAALVDAGGDIEAMVGPPDWPPWRIALPGGYPPPFDRAQVWLRRGAIATSSTARAWQRPDGTSAHHLIDPRAGHSAGGGIAAVTVLASHAREAEVLAKVLLIAGRERWPAVLQTWAPGDPAEQPSVLVHFAGDAPPVAGTGCFARDGAAP